MALHLHQLQRLDPLCFVEPVTLMLYQKASLSLRVAIENHIDVTVARLPHVFEELCTLLFRQRRNCIAQFIECLP